VGANVGIISVYLSKLATDSGCIHSFEPVKRTYEMLNLTIAINKSVNINTHRLGLSDTVGESDIHTFSEAHHTLNSLGKVDIDGNRPTHTEAIELTTLDTFCKIQNIHNIDVLKIDVEGFEDIVLKGAHTLLQAEKIRYIQFEISEMPLASIGKSSDDIFKILDASLYKVYRFNLQTDKFEGPITTRDNDFDNYYASHEDLTLLK
jgi:FkbM family methyltransferase